MEEQELNDNCMVIGDKCGDIKESSASKTKTDDCIVNNLDHSVSGFEHSSFNHDKSDCVKCLNFYNIQQSNEVLALKLSEYEKALTERDNTIKSLYSNMMNSENNNNILTNQYNSLMEKSKSINDTCTCLNMSYTNICERVSKLGDIVDTTRTSQKDVINLINQTTNKFQEQILKISDAIDVSLKKVSIEKIRAEEEIEILKNKYSFDLLAYKNNSEACAKEIEILKYENNILCEKLNDADFKLNEEKEAVLNINQHYEKLLKEMESQNFVLLDQNKSVNVKFDKIVLENQTLKDEIAIMKTSLDENKNQLEIQLNIIKEQTELLDDLKICKNLNSTLKKENFTLKECNEHLDKVNTELVDEISNIKLAHNEIQENKENKFKNMCQNYDDLLKSKEDRLQDISEQLKLQKEKESDIQNEVIDLKQELEMSNKHIMNLQDEVKANCILIPELQNKINGLNTELTITSQKLQESVQVLSAEKNDFEKEKTELENQNKDCFKQIEKLTSNYMKYKTKAKQLYIEVTRLRYQSSRSEQRKSKQPPTSEIIEISDEEVIVDDDISMVEFKNKSNMNVSMQSISDNINQINNSSFKRNFSPSNMNVSMQSISNNINQINNSSFKKKCSPFKHDDNSVVKKRMTSVDIVPHQKFMGNNQNVKGNYEQSNVNHNQITFNKNDSSKPVAKKMFKIPADIKPPQKKVKSMNMQTNNWSKPNSPVILTAASPRRSVTQPRVFEK